MKFFEQIVILLIIALLAIFIFEMQSCERSRVLKEASGYCFEKSKSPECWK